MPSNIAIRPATLARFPDVAIMVGPKNPDSSVCWCLSHRLDAKTNRSLVGRARGDYVKQLCRRRVAPGVLAYEDHDVVGWAAVAPRSELPFARSTKIPHIDDQPVWSVCGAFGFVLATAARASRMPCSRALWRTRGRRVRR